MQSHDRQAYQIARRREQHWIMLIVATAIIVLAILLRVRDDQRIEFRFLPGCPAPEMCLSKLWFKTDCPGCGLTRSMIHLAHGDWRASLEKHHIGWLMALAVLVQVPYRIIALRLPAQTRVPVWSRWFGGVLIGLLVGNWFLKLCY